MTRKGDSSEMSCEIAFLVTPDNFYLSLGSGDFISGSGDSSGVIRGVSFLFFRTLSDNFDFTSSRFGD